MQVQPYLFFQGRCDEALAFYQKTLGAQVGALMRFSENPDASKNPPDWGDKVMHCEFQVGDTQLLASDGMGGDAATFTGVSLAISTADAAESERMFRALSDGGKVQMPMARTFFSSAFGAVEDRFGVSWMLVAPPAEDAT